MKPATILRPCALCGKGFIVRVSHSKYCSTKCCNKRWADDNHHLTAAAAARWRAAHPEKLKESRAKYAAKNPEQLRAQATARDKAWRKANPELARERQRAKDVKKKGRRKNSDIRREQNDIEMLARVTNALLPDPLRDKATVKAIIVPVKEELERRVLARKLAAAKRRLIKLEQAAALFGDGIDLDMSDK